MREFTNQELYCEQMTDLECMMLNPAFIEKKPRQIKHGSPQTRQSRTTAVRRARRHIPAQSGGALVSEEEMPFIKTVFVIVAMFAIALFL